MAQVNRHRLHPLISSLFALVAIAYGVALLTSAYSSFAKDFIHRHQIQNLERRTGKSYAQWPQERSVQCSKEFSESKEIQEWKEVHHDICMSIPVMELVPDTEVVLAFLAARMHWLTGYVLAGALVTWLVGFLFAKAIPTGASRLWPGLPMAERHSDP